MIVEHMEKLRDIGKETGADLSALVELYSQKQSQYLHRDLILKKDVNGILYDHGYGRRALKVFDYVISRRGQGWFSQYVNQYKPFAKR